MGQTDPGAPRRGALDAATALVAVVALAATLVAAGLGACCLEPTTRLLSQQTGGAAVSPYAPEQLTELAVATRGFTVDDFGRSELGEGGARAALAEAVLAAAQDASAEGSPTVSLWERSARTALAGAPSEAPEEALLELARVGQRYALDVEALDHLDDVNRVIAAAAPALWASAALALACCIAAGARGGRRRVAGVLVAAGTAVLAALAALAAWAVLDFNGFFAAFHSLFFADGTWTFPYDSLLITMYPVEFWIGMGGVWLATTGLLSILAIVIGSALRRRSS